MRRLSPILILIMLVLLALAFPGKPGMTQALHTATPTPAISPETVLQARLSIEEPPGPAGWQPPTAAPAAEAPQAVDSIFDWTKIVYQSWFYDNYEIVIARGDGLEPQRLTFNAYYDGEARLNRGATKIVFTSKRDGDYEIFTMNADGTNVRQLTNNSVTDAEPGWSLDGSRVVYVSNESGHYEVYTVNADGSNRQRLTYSAAGRDAFAPSWSPNGKYIAFTTWNSDGYGYVWRAPSGGGSPTIISPYLLLPDNTTWSPDGLYLAYDHADEYYFTTKLSVRIVSSGYLYNVDIPKETTYEDHYVGSWSPDSKQLIFTRVKYTVSNYQLVITGATMETRCALSGVTCPRSNAVLPGTGTEFDFNPDWLIADLIPPESSFEPLPAYMPWRGFVTRWSSHVDGLAALAGHDVQSRANDGDWIYLFLENSLVTQKWEDKSEWYPPGTRISFRVRAYDEAGNKEAWPIGTYGETSTLLYTYQSNGKILDARGREIPDALLEISPQPVGMQQQPGKYQAWLSDPDSFQVSLQAAGYGALPLTVRSPHSDILQDLSLPAADNLLSNGDFEAGWLQGWAVTRTLSTTQPITAAVSSAYRATGGWGVTLGSACGEPCLTAPETFYDDDALTGVNAPTGVDAIEVTIPRWMDISVGQDGSLEVLTWRNEGLFAVSRSPLGDWSVPYPLDPNFASTVGATYVNVAPSGEVLALWMSPATGTYKLARKPPDGSWETSEDLPVDIDTWKLRDVIFDAEGGMYVVYHSVWTIYRSPEGVWSMPVAVGSSALSATLAVGSDKTLYSFWTTHSTYGDYLYFRLIHPDGTVGETLTLVKDGRISTSYLHAAVDSQERVHLFYGYYGTAHVIRYPDGNWSATDSLGTLYSASAPLALGFDGDRIRALSYQEGYYQWAPDQGWFTPPWTNFSGTDLDVDEQGLVHSISETQYFAPARAAEAGWAALEQRITIPAEMHQPTLAYMARWRGGSQPCASHYTVSVSDGLTTTILLTDTPASQIFEHNWLALGDWAGSEITLTFTLHQAQGEPLAYLDLDDISLGSWQTPVLTAVTPSIIERTTPTSTITISGANFIEMPQVYLGAVAVSAEDVTWVDEHTLLVSLPGTVRVGTFDVKVVNPGGQSALLSRALTVGLRVFLPTIRR